MTSPEDLSGTRPAHDTSPPPTHAAAPSTAERRKGYSRWEGELTPRGSRFWVVARGNLGLAWGSPWLKAVLILSLAPGVILSGITYFFLPLSAPALKGVLDGSLVFAFLAAALVGARLVSEDRRQGAFLSYFSRPVTGLDYVLGKAIALALPLLFVTTASGLLAIAADASVESETFADRLGSMGGVAEGTDGAYLRQTSYADAVLAVLTWGAVASITTTGIVLGLSALAERARTAGILWFAVVAAAEAGRGILTEILDKSWPGLISWRDNLADANAWLLDVDRTDVGLEPWTRVVALLAAAAAGYAFVYWRVERLEGVNR